jgi:hypothetical protein
MDVYTHPVSASERDAVSRLGEVWLVRDDVEKCFYTAFSNTAYGQQEYNDDLAVLGKFHYHLQYVPNPLRQTGFSSGIHQQGH